MTLADTLEARLRRELAEAREVLAPMLEEPFYQANSLAAWGDPSKLGSWEQWRQGPAGPVPALFVKPDGSWWGAGVEGHVERVASCGEALALLEKHAPNVAEYEARAMTLAGELLVSDAEERAAWLERAVRWWVWTEAGGSLPGILPMLVTNLADLVDVVNGTERRLRVPGPERPDLPKAYAEAMCVADATAWIAEALERRETGRGARYRAWCDGSALVDTYSEIGPDGAFVGPAVVQPRRLARPNAGWHPGQLMLGNANDGAGDLVSGPQLLWLYWALPPAVLHARALRRDVERIASGDEPRSRLERVAKLALAEDKAEASEDACDKLAGALRRNVGKLRPILRLDALPPTTAREALALLDTINEAFAVYVEKRGDAGARVAGATRAHAKRDANADAGVRWASWRAVPNEEPKWLVALAVVVWLHEVKREVTQRPALVMPVHAEVTRIHSRAFVLETLNGQRALTFDDTAPIMLASIADASLAKLVERGAKLLGSVNAHKLLRWELVTGHTQALRGDADPRMLVVDGGWSTLAFDVLRIKGKRAAEEIRAITHAQQAVTFPLPSGGTAHGLLTLHDTPARGRRRGHIEIVLGSMLLPHFVHEIGGHGRDASEARRLVPVLQELPPMVGRDNEHGALATLSMLVVRELRIHARELAEVGSVEIKPERFEALAREVRLPLPTLRLALPVWLRDGDDAPAFLASPSPDRFTLGPAHAPELAFLVAAGRDVLVSSNAGLKSVEARSRKRRRLGRGE